MFYLVNKPMSFKSNIWKMYVFKLLRNLQFIGGVLIPFFLDWGQISFTQIMLLQSFFVISAFLLEIPTGAVADYLGRKTSLIIGAFFTATATFVYALFPSFYLFLVGEFFWALGVALFSGADEALIYDSLKKIRSENKSKKIFGRFYSFEMVGLMVSAPIGSIIAATIGLRYTMMLVAVPQLLGAFLAFSFKEPKTKRKIESRRYWSILINGVKYFRGHKVLKILTFDKVFITTLVFFVIWTYQPLLMSLNIPIFYFGFVHAAICGVQIIFFSNLERLEKLFRSKKRYLYWSAIISGVSFFLLGLGFNVFVVIGLILIISGFGFSRDILFRNYMNKHIESGHRATVISTVSMLDRFVAALLYPLVGLLVERSLNWTFVIIGLAILFINLVSRVREEHLID